MKRSSVLLLSVLRLIKGTLGRYLAIFAIIALGVGFFAGLRVSTDAMLKTAGDYLREKKLYDFRLISTLGLREADVAAFAALDGVETAVGSVTEDFLCAGSEGDVVSVRPSGTEPKIKFYFGAAGDNAAAKIEALRKQFVG